MEEKLVEWEEDLLQLNEKIHIELFTHVLNCVFLLQLTPIEKYAMKFLENTMEPVALEELKEAEVSDLLIANTAS